MTHNKTLTITGEWTWDMILGIWFALPLSITGFAFFDQKKCAVPIVNSIQSSINALYFYYYFANHSLDSGNLLFHDGTYYKFTDQEIYKNFAYIIFNILTVAAETPYMITKCFTSDQLEVSENESYKLHMFNQGLLKIFLIYSYFESTTSYLFFGEYLMSTYFGTVGFFEVL